MNHDSPARPVRSFESELALLAAAAGVAAGLLTAAAASAAPTRPDTEHRERAARLLESGEHGRAVYHLRRHLETTPGDVDARRRLAGACRELGLTREALTQLHLVLAELPGDAAARLELARVQVAVGQPADALDTVRGLRADGETGPDLDELEGRILSRLGRSGEAVTALASAVGSRPDDPDLLNLLAMNRLDADPDGAAQAVELLRRAVDLESDNPTYRNNLGFALERAGRLQEAFLEYSEAEGLTDGRRYGANRQRVQTALAR